MVKRVYAFANQHLLSYLMFYGLFHAANATLAVFGNHILPDLLMDLPDVVLFLVLFFLCLIVLLFRGNNEYPPVIFPELRKNEFRLLIAFFFVSTVNTLWVWMLVGEGTRAHFARLFFTAANIFASYPLGAYFGRSGKDLCFRRLMRVLTWGVCAYILFGIIWIFFGDPLSNVSMHFYMYRKRLWLNANPNTLGMHCCILLMMMPYTFYGLAHRKKLFSAVLAGAILLTGLLFSDSRAAFLSLALGAGLSCGVYLWERYGHLSILKRLCIAVAVFAAICMVLFGSRVLFQEFITSLPGGVMVEAHENVTVSRPDNSAKAPARATVLGSGGKTEGPQSVTVSRSDGSANVIKSEASNRAGIIDKGGNGRVRIWKCVFQTLKNNPAYLLHGCTVELIPKVLAENGLTKEMYTHNQFLEILLGLGLPTLLLFMGWLLILGQKCLQLGLSRNHPWAQRILPVVILIILFCNMFEAILLFFRSIAGEVFFLFAGYVFGLMEQRKTAEKVEHISIKMPQW